MLKIFYRGLLPGSLLLALAGCCGNVACNCNDRLADSLFISIGRRDGTARHAFSDRELATVYLTRYDLTTRKAIDSLPLPRATRRPTSYSVPLFPTNVQNGDTAGVLVISNGSPFSSTTANANLSKYYYKLYVPQDSSNGTTLTMHRYYKYVFDRISLQGSFQADGCCTCYSNTDKRVRVSGGPAILANGRLLSMTDTTNVTGDVSQTTATRTPVIIYLSK